MLRRATLLLAVTLLGCPSGQPEAPTTPTAARVDPVVEEDVARQLALVDELLAAWRPADALAAADKAVAASDRPETRAARERAQRCVDAHALGVPEATVLAVLRLPAASWRTRALEQVSLGSDALKAPNALAPDRSIDGAHVALPGRPASGRAPPAEQIGLQQTLDRAHRLFSLVARGEADATKLDRAEKDLAWVEVRTFKGRVAPDVEAILSRQVVHVKLARLLALLALGRKADAASGATALRAEHPEAAGPALDVIEREARGT
jgi:hypothetical protein